MPPIDFSLELLECLMADPNDWHAFRDAIDKKASLPKTRKEFLFERMTEPMKLARAYTIETLRYLGDEYSFKEWWQGDKAFFETYLQTVLRPQMPPGTVTVALWRDPEPDDVVKYQVRRSAEWPMENTPWSSAMNGAQPGTVDDLVYQLEDWHDGRVSESFVQQDVHDNFSNLTLVRPQRYAGVLPAAWGQVSVDMQVRPQIAIHPDAEPTLAVDIYMSPL